MGRPLTGLVLPFEGLPPLVRLLFWVAFVLILVGLVWTCALFAASRRALAGAPAPADDLVDQFLWVFLVPALDEEVTIVDSVNRLLAVEAANKAIIVIDDGSSDGTASVLAELESDELTVLRRTLPDARTGKAAALNTAWRSLGDTLATGRWAGWRREQVVVVVVDADGRLDPAVPRFAAAHFADPAVGGLQTLVRIYNRSRPLTWLQDVEFSVYGLLFQAGRTALGTAGMGGNGQLNRLSALDSVADVPGGPWHDRLTEDQDLGLRLLEAGWRCVSDARVSVEQQGVSDVRRLLRQRTRWAQGNLQAMSHLGSAWGLDRSWVARLDLMAYLLQPVFQALIGAAFVVSVILAVSDVADFWGDNGWLQLTFFFVLGFGGVVLGCVARGARDGALGILLSIVVVPIYAAYSWLIWPVLTRATARQLTSRRDWAKTAREPIRRT